MYILFSCKTLLMMTDYAIHERDLSPLLQHICTKPDVGRSSQLKSNLFRACEIVSYSETHTCGSLPGKSKNSQLYPGYHSGFSLYFWSTCYHITHRSMPPQRNGEGTMVHTGILLLRRAKCTLWHSLAQNTNCASVVCIHLGKSNFSSLDGSFWILAWCQCTFQRRIEDQSHELLHLLACNQVFVFQSVHDHHELTS